jgi:flagellar biosynthesis protein FlhF
MQVKRFVAADMRRALELVRQELGPDAIILSSNRVKDGVELITTLAGDSELAQLQQQPFGRAALASASPTLSDGAAWTDTGLAAAERAARQHSVVFTDPAVGTASGKTGQQLAEEIEQARLRMLASRQAEESAREHLLGQQQANVIPRRASLSAPAPAVEIPQPAATPKHAVTAAERYGVLDEEPTQATASQWQENNAQLADLQAELADMRFLLEQQLEKITGTSTGTGSPVLASVGRRLERLGFPGDVVTRVLSRCAKKQVLAEAWPEALANLAQQLPVGGKDIVDQGGIFAFVGPTGVGKTTTIGKLAARYVLQHGADQVALVTTDTYRIAGHDQLRSLARILRVPVRVVDENNPLEQVLASLKHCSLVLIDTAGFRHGDPLLKSQLQALARLPQVKSYLVLSCNSQQQMLKASVHAYSAAGLKGCVLTKLDETASMGEALGVIMQTRLPIAYTTDGQDIPKHIEVARGHQLVSKAVALLKNQRSALATS